MRFILWIFTTIYCIAAANSQEKDCNTTDQEALCVNLITIDTRSACYVQDLGDSNKTSILNLCCETCTLLRNVQGAYPTCDFGDRSIECGPENCTVPGEPPREDTRMCCLTCRSSLEEHANGTTASPTSSGSDSSTSAPGNNGAQRTETTSSSTSSASDSSTSAPATTGPSTEQTTVSSASAASSSVTSASAVTKSQGAQTTAGSANSGSGSSTSAPAGAQSRGEQTTASSANSNSVSSTSAPSNAGAHGAQPTDSSGNVVPGSAVDRAASVCPDSQRCNRLHPSYCYMELIRNKCCATCNEIARSNSQDCPYGDRMPGFCRKMHKKHPAYICVAQRDICCETCKNVSIAEAVSRFTEISSRQNVARGKGKSRRKSDNNRKKKRRKGRKGRKGGKHRRRRRRRRG